MNEIGLFIKKRRKELGLTQKELADKLNVSFQAISKWETGETLPDTSLLLILCNELETSVDTLLNGGVVVSKSKKLIRVENIVMGFNHLASLKNCFGEDSPFYKGIIEGVSMKMNFNFEETLRINPEVLYTEVIIGYLLNGYRVDIEEAKTWIKNEKYINEILKRM